MGEHHEHEDATKDSYANDTYINASLEKNGNYTISCEVVSVIPKETVKEVMNGSLIQHLDPMNVPSKRRNPLLADFFNRLELMERRGSEIKCTEST